MSGISRETNVIERMTERESVLSKVPERYLNLIKRTVAVGATNEELEMFLYTASQYDLDPLMREIVFFKAGGIKGKPVMVVTRDGYLKTAMKDPDFDGLISFVVRENDEFSIDAETFSVTHRFGQKDRGKIIGAWAKATHKRRQPVMCFVDYAEYRKRNHQAWDQYPSAMIQKVAEVFALRRQFNIAGVVAREEIDYDDSKAKISPRERLAEQIKEIDDKAIEAEYTKKEETSVTEESEVLDKIDKETEDLGKEVDEAVSEAKKTSAETSIDLDNLDLTNLDDLNKILVDAGMEENNPDSLVELARKLLKRDKIEVSDFAKIREMVKAL